MKRKITLAFGLLFIAALAVAQNTYNGFFEPSDWAAQSGGKTFHPWYAPNDPANPIGATLTHGRASGFSTAVYRPESYGAKYNVNTVKQAKANSKAIADIITDLPDTGGKILLRDELYTWGTINLPTRVFVGSPRQIPFEIIGEGRGRTRLINLEPDVPAIEWQHELVSPTQHVSGVPAIRLEGLSVISQGPGALFTGLGKLLEIHDVEFTRCHGTGMTCSQLYGGSITDVYCVANYGKGADFDQCNMLHLDLTTRMNLDDGVEMTGCGIITGRLLNEGDVGWGLDADTINNSKLDVYFEANRTPAPFVAVANATNNNFTKVAHGLVNQDYLTVSTYGTLAAPLAAATTYYVTNAAADTFQLSATINGAAIDLTTAGTGDQYIRASTFFEKPQVRFRKCWNLDLSGIFWQDRGYGLDLDNASFIGIRQQREPDWPAATALSLGATLAEHGGTDLGFWDATFQPTLTFDDADSLTFTAIPGTYNHATNNVPGTQYIELFDTVLAAVAVTAGDWIDITCDIELDAAAAAYFTANPKKHCMRITVSDAIPGEIFTAGTYPSTYCYHRHSVNTMRFHARAQATGSDNGMRCFLFPYGLVEADGDDANDPAVGHSIRVHNVKIHKISQ